MAVSSEFREYKMNDGQLSLFTNVLCSILTRNLVDLAVFGITEEKISQLEAFNDEFKNFSQDELFLCLIMDATEEKKVASESIKNTLRNMALRCQMKWGSDSWQENSLGIAGMNKFIDDTLLNASRRVHEKMTGFLSELADTGLTAEILDNFETLNNSFEFAINLQKDRINERRVKTSERITKGNELYAIVSKYCDIGKRVYAGRSPAHYNDFIIYGPSPGSIKAPEGLKFNPLTREISWEITKNATSYQLESSKDGENFVEIYAGPENSFIYPAELTSNIYLRCRARNANGYGKFCGKIIVETII